MGAQFFGVFILHTVDRIDDVEKRFGASLVVGDIGGSVISWLDDAGIVITINDVFVDVELLLGWDV